MAGRRAAAAQLTTSVGAMTAALVVMAKAPVAGRCKTRLCPPLDPAQAATLAEAALADTLQTVAWTPADAMFWSSMASLGPGCRPASR